MRLLVPVVIVTLVVAVLQVTSLLISPPTAGADAAAEGFGATTRGGGGRPRYHVTSLANAGPGTLRDAISQGHRHVVFDIAGTIQVESTLSVRGSFITIDGMTPQAPGITIRAPAGFGAAILEIDGISGAHDVIVRGIRVRGAATRDTNVKTSNDCMAISRGAYNVLVDRVSISGCTDGALDITNHSSGPETRNVTVQWSILADTRKLMLVKYGTTRLTLHHNLFVRSVTRMPHVNREGLPPDPGLTLDMRNNVIYDWAGGAATQITRGATANVVGNLYGNPGGSIKDQHQALTVVGARAYTAGNVSLDGADLDAMGTVGSPFPAADVTTTPACAAARKVLAAAGAPPRDAVDSGYVGLVTMDACS